MKITSIIVAISIAAAVSTPANAQIDSTRKFPPTQDTTWKNNKKGPIDTLNRNRNNPTNRRDTMMNRRRDTLPGNKVQQ